MAQPLPPSTPMTWKMRGLNWPLARRLLRESIVHWWHDDVPHMGAALAFYSVLSIAPLFMLGVAMLGFMFGPEAAQGQVIAQLRDLIGAEGAKAMGSIIESASQHPHRSQLATVIGTILLLIGAVGTFAELQNTLNRIWKVPPAPYKGVMDIVQRRLFSFGLVLGFGFLLLVSLLISTALSAAKETLGQHIPGMAYVIQTVHLIISFGVITVLFGTIFHLLPDTKVRWQDVWVGACITALIFTLGKFLIGFYLGHSMITTVYGAAGSFVVLILWVYFSSQLVFFGAEFTHAYARHHLPVPHPAKMPPNADPALANGAPA
jgi:membrane protein